MSKRVFMDGTDWDCEIGSNANGNTVYPNVKSVEAHHPKCIEECGIAEVEVRFVRWVKEPATDGIHAFFCTTKPAP